MLTIRKEMMSLRSYYIVYSFFPILATPKWWATGANKLGTTAALLLRHLLLMGLPSRLGWAVEVVLFSRDWWPCGGGSGPGAGVEGDLYIFFLCVAFYTHESDFLLVCLWTRTRLHRCFTWSTLFSVLLCVNALDYFLFVLISHL